MIKTSIRDWDYWDAATSHWPVALFVEVRCEHGAFFLDWIIQIQWTESFRLTHRLVHVILTAWWNPSKQHSNVHVVRKSTLHLPMLWSSDTWFYCIILNKKTSIYLISYSTYESIWTHEWFEKYRLEPAYKKTPNSLIITLHLFETSSVSCINSV